MQILLTNAGAYSKGLLSEILDFVMGTGLIPADGQIWRSRRRAIVPSLHKKYIAAMVRSHKGDTQPKPTSLPKTRGIGNYITIHGLPFLRLARVAPDRPTPQHTAEQKGHL